MKLFNRSEGNWQYALNQTEFGLLCHLMKKFPHTRRALAKISKTDTDPKSVERTELLNESLVEHRKELKRQAMNLIAGNKVKISKKRHLLTWTAEDREILLQILNDIRVESWRALGEPENLELEQLDGSAQELKYRSLMNLASYFEHHVLGSK
jgi:hypothetical protein